MYRRPPRRTRDARTGDTVWIVGAPSTGRDVAVDERAGCLVDGQRSCRSEPVRRPSGLLETGAAIGPASSGGALVDADGHVTGIVSRRSATSRMTYAVPIDDRGHDRRRARDDGHARSTGRSGISGIDDARRPDGHGRDVAAGPRQHAGMRVGDVV